MSETTTARESAIRWGISEAAARRILAPLTPIDRDPITGAMRYNQGEADAARANRPGRGSRADLSAEAISTVRFQQLASDDAIPVTHRALWALLWEGGVRVGSALSMDVRDVAIDDHVVVQEYPKLDSDERIVPLSEQTASLLREAVGDRIDGPLIVNENGRPIGRDRAARASRTLANASIHAFRMGGQKARKSLRPPRIMFAALSTDWSGEDPTRTCQCPCAHVHSYRGREVCQGSADAALLVDVTVLSGMTGEVDDRRLRPFCPGCYEALLAQKENRKELKKLRRKLG
ncbi:tyrosine-type recombinase/integrase [Streptomyces abikoensis]|uniref:Tyrosine-type recombinase/integrase n=1 Tax=Streptomyces abikoensis TaxID=97398 RepID=A0ABW7T9N6_9ACTN